MDGPAARDQFMANYCRDAVQFALAVGEDMVRIGWLMGRPTNATWVGPNELHWRSDDGLRFGRFLFEPDSDSANTIEDWLAESDGVDRLIGWLRSQEADYRGLATHTEADFPDLRRLVDEAAGRLALADTTGSVGIPNV